MDQPDNDSHAPSFWRRPAGMAAYFWRRDVMATIVVGMAVYLPLHIGFGW